MVGYGRIGQRHAAIIRKHPEARLCAVADTSDAQPGAPFFHSLEEMLASPEASAIDIVSIATPNGLHAAQACICLEAGKHVLVEKPVALHSADMERMLALARRRDRVIFPVLQNRLAPGAVWLKELVASGRLGSPFLVKVDCFWNRDKGYYPAGGWHGTERLDGGVLFTQFSHFVDLLYWLFGDITDVHSQFLQGRHWSEEGFADTGSVQFRFGADAGGRGAIGSLHFSTAVWDRNMDSSITIVGEHGSVKVRGQYLDSLDYYHVRGEADPRFPQGVWSPEEGHRRMIDSVVDSLLGRRNTTVAAEDAARVIAMIESMYEHK